MISISTDIEKSIFQGFSPYKCIIINANLSLYVINKKTMFTQLFFSPIVHTVMKCKTSTGESIYPRQSAIAIGRKLDLKVGYILDL